MMMMTLQNPAAAGEQAESGSLSPLLLLPAVVVGGAAGGAAEALNEAPPKQVAMAMEQLTEAGKLIADIRVGADRVLEAIFLALLSPPSSSSSSSNKSSSATHINMLMMAKEESSIRTRLQQLRAIGRKLEASGVLSGSRTQGSHWGLQLPLVCPDGAVVGYAWKRQLAGQAAASAVDRARLALKAFTDQKRRFFPHLDNDLYDLKGFTESDVSKKLCTHKTSAQEHIVPQKNLQSVVSQFEENSPFVKIFTYRRMDWSKRALSLSSMTNDPTLKETVPSGPQGYGDAVSQFAHQVAVLELSVPSVFRAVVSLHPAGSVTPDAVSVFSPDEGGVHMHPRGTSVHHVYRHITKVAEKALQYYYGAEGHLSLELLLSWICTYGSLFSKVCSKCHRLLAVDRVSASLLPPVCRPYRKSQERNSETCYHYGCSPWEL